MPASHTGPRSSSDSGLGTGSAGHETAGHAADEGVGQAGTQPDVRRTRRASAGTDGRLTASSDPPQGDPSVPVVLGIRSLPHAFDPMRPLAPWAHRIAADLLFEGLTRRDSQGAPWARPQLADHCVVDSVEATTAVRCHLRADARFHDGAQVTTADVLYSVDHWLDPRREWNRLQFGLGAMSGVRAVDGPFTTPTIDGGPGADPSRWVEVRFRRPDPLALEHLAEIKIVPVRQHRGHRSQFSRQPVGSGPMRLESMDDDEIVLVSTRAMGARTATDRIVIRHAPDGAKALTRLRRGELDYLDAMTPDHVPVELAKPGMAARFEAFLASPPRYDLLLYNVRSPPQAGARMRAALDATIPRFRLQSAAYPRFELSLSAPVDLYGPSRIDLAALAAASDPRDVSAGLPTLPFNNDPAEAMRGALLLDALGWKRERRVRRRDGTALRLALMWHGGSGRAQEVASVLRTAFLAQGIQLPYATASWAYVRLLLRRGDYELFLVQLAQHSDADLFPLFHRDGALNITGVRDVELDAALEAYRRAQTRLQRDAAKAAVADHLKRLHVVSVLRSPAHVSIVSRRLAGLRFCDDLPCLDSLHHSSRENDWWQRRPQVGGVNEDQNR